MLNKSQKLLLGIIILLIVNIIWVSTSELTKFLYENDDYEKPFFCTYFKTSMFTTYLMIIGLIAPWKETCDRHNGTYAIMEQSTDDDQYYVNHPSLSDPTFVPIHSNGGTISGTESDDSSIRSVRFSKLAEVREMSAHEATEALMARLSYAASMRIKKQKSHHKTARTALLFCILWFLTNYLYQVSTELISTSFCTLLSSSSSLFTLILAACFPSSSGDKFTISKVIAVIVNIAGVMTITISDIHEVQFSRGALLALLSALFHSAYLVFVKRKNDVEDKIDIPLFFGFVGLWNLFLMWPIIFILNFTLIEQFELPTRNQTAILLLNGIMGTIIPQALWLWGSFLTSSLIGIMAMTLQIPLYKLFEILLKGAQLTPKFYIGFATIFIALLLIALLMRYDDSDPLMRLLKMIYKKLCLCKQPNIVRINDEEQQESLIGNND